MLLIGKFLLFLEHFLRLTELGKLTVSFQFFLNISPTKANIIGAFSDVFRPVFDQWPCAFGDTGESSLHVNDLIF